MKHEAIIQLEFTTRCNHDCEYCPRYLIGKTRSLGDIAPEMADLLVNRLSEIKDKHNLLLSVSGFGEPLLYPGLIDLICRIKSASNARIRLNTNISLLHKIGHELISSKCVDYLTLSLNLPTEELHKKYTVQDAFKTLKRNIIAFLQEKQNRRPAANIRFIKMPETIPYLDEFIKEWKKHLNRNDQVSVADLANWGGLIGGSIKPRTGPCRYLTYQAGRHLSITLDGYASICCFSTAFSQNHPLVVGNIKDHSIKELLALAKLRAKELVGSSVCENCNTPEYGGQK